MEIKEKFPEINPVVLQLLYNRGLTEQSAIDGFVNPDYGQDLHDPYLFQDMPKAVDRIFKAIRGDERMVVHGDYDADGVCASVLLHKVLTAMGGQVEVFLPQRDVEGYGMNRKTIEKFIADKVKLIITVDCGLSNREEITLAQKSGIDTIVTDHHQEPPKLPDKAIAIINPALTKETYPFKKLAGVGVAYKLCQALVKDTRTRLEEDTLKWLMDLVAVGTVADISPLIGENRTMVYYGLVVLQKTRCLGLRELILQTSLNLPKLDTHDIGYKIAPRINAAGRIDHANTAFQLLTTNNPGEASQIAAGLNQTNVDRQQMTDLIIKEAKEQIGQVTDRKKVLIAHGKDWPTGIVGLVAGRLADEFNRPVLIIGGADDQPTGSGRSIPGFNITAAMQQVAKHLARYGGHEQACGFTLKNREALADFKKDVKEIASQEIKNEHLIPEIDIELEAELEEITWDLFAELEKFKPYGEANPRPKFAAKNLNVVGLQSVGSDNQHLRIMVNHKTTQVYKTIGFCFGDWCQRIKIGDQVDLIFEVDINEWNGSRELQLKIKDIRLSQDQDG